MMVDQQAIRQPAFSLKRLMALSLMVAASVVLKRFLGFNISVISISLGFLPIALAGALLGPLGGLMAGALADIVGATLFPFGPFNPGFTLMAMLSGLCYGYFLSSPLVPRWRVLLCQALITVLLHMVMNTLLLVPILGKGFMALIPTRFVKNALMYPIEVLLLTLVVKYRDQFARQLR